MFSVISPDLGGLLHACARRAGALLLTQFYSKSATVLSEQPLTKERLLKVPELRRNFRHFGKISKLPKILYPPTGRSLFHIHGLGDLLLRMAGQPVLYPYACFLQRRFCPPCFGRYPGRLRPFGHIQQSSGFCVSARSLFSSRCVVQRFNCPPPGVICPGAPHSLHVVTIRPACHAQAVMLLITL